MFANRRLKLIELFSEKGAKVDFNDLMSTNSQDEDVQLQNGILYPDREELNKYDCVVISTDHTAYDYAFIARHARLVIDTRKCL